MKGIWKASDFGSGGRKRSHFQVAKKVNKYCYLQLTFVLGGKQKCVVQLSSLAR